MMRKEYWKRNETAFQFELRYKGKVIHKEIMSNLDVSEYLSEDACFVFIDEQGQTVEKVVANIPDVLFKHLIGWVMDRIEKEIDIDFIDEHVTFGLLNDGNKIIEETFNMMSLGLDGKSFGPIDEKWLSWLLKKATLQVKLTKRGAIYE